MQHLESVAKQMVDARPGTRLPALVDLGQQPGTRLLGLPGGVRAGRDGLHEAVLSLGHRVDAGVYPHAQ